VDRRDRIQLVEEGDCCLASRIPRSCQAAGKDVPAGTMAMVSSTDFLRASERPTAISTLNRQRHLTPSCGGSTPTAERTVASARISLESLTPRPGIREQNRRKAAGHAHVRSRRQNVHASPEGSGLSLAKADMQPSITARTQLGPIYMATRLVTIALARWEYNRRELFGRKGRDDMVSSLTSNPLHRRHP
jgi:hypothetical protein